MVAFSGEFKLLFIVSNLEQLNGHIKDLMFHPEPLTQTQIDNLGSN